MTYVKIEKYERLTFSACTSEQRKSVKPPIRIGRCIFASCTDTKAFSFTFSFWKSVDLGSESKSMIAFRMNERKLKLLEANSFRVVSDNMCFTSNVAFVEASSGLNSPFTARTFKSKTYRPIIVAIRG